MLAVTIVGAEHVIGCKDKPEFLFALSAQSGSFDGKTLTLKDIPLVIYFSDRPNRISGHISLKKFVKLWGKGTDSFKVDPPNATLSILDESGNRNAVIEISTPVLIKKTITFTVDILQGTIPTSFSAGSLFIDNWSFASTSHESSTAAPSILTPRGK